MDFLINNWYVMVAAIVVLAGAGYSVYIFIKKSSTEQHIIFLILCQIHKQVIFCYLFYRHV